jgi:uncharacterized protein (UPF0179 family)
VYLGLGDECSKCPLKTPCHHNLDRGRRYVVVGVKNKSHPCKLFEEVLVCDVKEVGIDVSISPGSAFEGATIRFNPQPCDKKLCVYTGKCIPEGLSDGDRCTIISIKGKIKCPEKGELSLVKVKRI